MHVVVLTLEDDGRRYISVFRDDMRDLSRLTLSALILSVLRCMIGVNRMVMDPLHPLRYSQRAQIAMRLS